jgi:hypothetical protein
MQRCPECGYRDKYDWPMVLWVIGFGLLWVVYIATERQMSHVYRWVGLAAFLIFVAGSWTYSRRQERNRKEYLKLHPGPSERVREHIRPNPANS